MKIYEKMNHYTIEEILTMSNEEQEKICIFYNDCSCCPLALVKDSYSRPRFKCAHGLKKERLELELEDGAYLMGGMK